MRHDPPLVIELEDKQPTELLVVVVRVPAKPLRDLVDLSTAARGQRTIPLIFTAGGFPTRFPADEEFFGTDCGRGGGGGREGGGEVFHDALREDRQADVADYRDAAPGYGSSPERSVVGDTAGNGGEVGVRGGKEVEGYVGRKNFLGERGGEEGWQARLEGSEGYREVESWLATIMKVDFEVQHCLLLPSFRVRSSGGGASDL